MEDAPVRQTLETPKAFLIPLCMQHGIKRACSYKTPKMGPETSLENVKPVMLIFLMRTHKDKFQQG